MSKLGKKPIIIPDGVKVSQEGSLVSVNGPKGSLSYSLLDGIFMNIQDNVITFSIDSDDKKNLWGLSRVLVDNMVIGVSVGYQKKMLILGVGFGVKHEQSRLNLSLGFSHPVFLSIPDGVTVATEKDVKGNDIITIDSINKELLGKFAADLRALKKPEPYKGKGIRYFDEVVKIKAGKTAKK